MKNYLLLILLGMATAAFAGKVYIYKDASGKTVYSDLPPQGGADYQQKRLGANVIDTSGYPYEVQQAIKNFPVTLWGTTCGPVCDQAKALLEKRGIPFEGKDPAASAAALEAFKTLSGGNTIPVLQIGSRQLKSFDAASWNSALTAAGYPLTASKAMRAPVSSSPK